ncbi:MAG: hypothetical protein ACK4UL_00530, partial [Novosphingobium meiothermophilum]
EQGSCTSFKGYGNALPWTGRALQAGYVCGMKLRLHRRAAARSDCQSAIFDTIGCHIGISCET